MKTIYNVCFSFFIFFLFLIVSCNSSDNINNNSDNNDTTKKNKSKSNPYVNAKLDIKIFSNDTVKSESKLSGFGYDIYIYDALYVHQPNVPAINGNRGFKTKDQAQKAGDLVAFKIKMNIMPPSVTISELDSLELLK